MTTIRAGPVFRSGTACLPIVAGDDELVRAVQLHVGAGCVFERIERRLLALLLEHDLSGTELRRGRADADLERSGLCRRISRACRFRSTARRPPGNDVGAASGEHKDKDEAQE